MKKEQIVVISDHTVDPADRMISENTLPGLSKLFSDLAKLKVEDTKASIIEGYDFNEKMAKEVVKTTLIYLDEHVKHNIKGRKRGLSRSEKSELEGQVLGFINDFYDNPKLDGGLIRSNQKNSGLILSQVGSTYYSVENGIPILLASKTTGDGIKAAFSVDVLIEFISLFTSLAGFSIKLPKGARKAIAKVIAKFARNKRHRELLKQLYKALYKKD